VRFLAIGLRRTRFLATSLVGVDVEDLGADAVQGVGEDVTQGRDDVAAEEGA